MREMLARAEGKPQSGRPLGRTVTLKEQIFIDAYLQTGDEKKAARVAGFKDSARTAADLLEHPRVAAAINSAVDKRMESAKLSRSYILDKHIEIVEGVNVFARIKSLEQLSKLMGYFAPIKHQTIAGQEGNPYAQLTETLRAQGASFTEDERAQLRVQLISDLASIQEALALLGGSEKVS